MSTSSSAMKSDIVSAFPSLHTDCALNRQILSLFSLDVQGDVLAELFESLIWRDGVGEQENKDDEN